MPTTKVQVTDRGSDLVNAHHYIGFMLQAGDLVNAHHQGTSYRQGI